jgi:hypothetical protein
VGQLEAIDKHMLLLSFLSKSMVSHLKLMIFLGKMFAAENEPTRSKKCNQITSHRRQIENTQISTSIKAKACAELAFLLAQIITHYQNVFR